MHIARVRSEKRVFYGKVENDLVCEIKGEISQSYVVTQKKHKLKDVKILTPSLPTKIVLVGLNYKDHAKELNLPIPEEPVIFMKPGTSILAHGEAIIYPASSRQVDYEAELAFIIKKRCEKVKKEHADEFILGYTCLNDVTARDLQKKDGQWTRAKSFNTFCPFGPFLWTDIKDFNPHHLSIRTFLNNEQKQDSNTSNLIFKIDYLLEYISHIMTLFPGDVISTGTPVGVGPMKPGDEIAVEIEQVGRLVNFVIKE